MAAMINRLTDTLNFQTEALVLRSERQRLIASNIANADHIQPLAGARSEAGLRFATASQTNLDNNSVDMDRERASFADNSVKYEATLRFINGSVRTMLDAIKGQSS